MSGIYIPNLKMPENCFYCQLGEDGYCLATDPIRNRDWRLDQFKEHCPLVSVPDHGRLIIEDGEIIE